MIKTSYKSSDNLNERMASSDKLVEANVSDASDSSPIGEDRNPASATSLEVPSIMFYDDARSFKIHPSLFDTHTFKPFLNKKPSNFNSIFETER